MKKLGFILGLIFTLSTVHSFAQEVGETKGAVISLDKDEHDYGTILQGVDGKCEFVITNNGNEPLILAKCEPSCGCTIPTCPVEPIAPGKSITIVVKYDTNRVGPINKSVTIRSNASNEANYVIRIKGNVKAKAAKTENPVK